MKESLPGNRFRANTAVKVGSECTNTFSPEIPSMSGKGIASGAHRVLIGDDNDASSFVAELSEMAKKIANPRSGNACRPEARRVQTRRAVSKQASGCKTEVLLLMISLRTAALRG